MSFNAIILEKNEVTGFSHSLKTITKQQLFQQQGDTLVKIQYSSINYKDALALTNKSPIVRQWPRSEERRVGKECRARWSTYN